MPIRRVPVLPGGRGCVEARALCCHNTGLQMPPSWNVPGVCSCPLLQFHRALHANLQLFIHQPRLFSCLRVPSDTAHPCTQPLMLHTVPGALSAANKYLIVCQLYLNKNGYDEVIPN